MRHLYLIRVKNCAELEHLYKVLCYNYKYCQGRPCKECYSRLCERLDKLKKQLYKQLY